MIKIRNTVVLNVNMLHSYHFAQKINSGLLWSQFTPLHFLHRPEEALDGAGDSVPMFGLGGGGGPSHGLDGTPSPLSLGMEIIAFIQKKKIQSNPNFCSISNSCWVWMIDRAKILKTLYTKVIFALWSLGMFKVAEVAKYRKSCIKKDLQMRIIL